MKTKIPVFALLMAGILCLPYLALAAPACNSNLGVPPEHEMWQRPVELCRGVKLRAYALDEPRLMKAFVARINLDEPGIGFTATDRDEKWGEPMPDYTNRTVLIHTKRETTPNFMMQRRAAGEPVVLAVNATPWGPWDCAAAFRSTYGSLGGWNVSHGVELSQSKRPRRGALFVVYKDGKADIVTSVAENRAKDVAFAFGGFGLIMTNGVPTAYARRLKNQAPAQRTAFGLDASRKTLVLLVVDGRQPDYSIGAFGMDLYEILRREGVTDAVNMDGGGSSTLTVFDAKLGKPWTFTRSNPRRNALNVGILLDEGNRRPLPEAAPREIERTASVYHSYEFEPIADTPAPDGFKPFYISHYGRHGSRLLTGTAVGDVMKALEKAEKGSALTATGRALLGDMRKIAAVHDDMKGQLAERGAQEHRCLARRMADRFPEVFARPRRVHCRSSVSPRVLISQANFTMALKEAVPHLDFDFLTGERHHKVINPLHWALMDKPDIGPRTEKLAASFAKGWIDPKPLVGRIFAADGGPKDPLKFARALFECASICQCCRCELGGLDIYRFFEAGEIDSLSRAMSARHYMTMGNSEEFGDFVSASEAKLARDMAVRAEAAIADGRIAADLRFGHDSGLWPLAGYLGLEGPGDRVKAADSPSGCPSWKWLPMAANFQMVLYRNAAGEILGKFLWNEREMRVRGVQPAAGPYYRWNDIRRLLETGAQQQASSGN